MPSEIASLMLPLFAPGDRPDWVAKAAAAGPDAVIVDLEDAVAAGAKAAARDGLAEALSAMPAIVSGNTNAAVLAAADKAADLILERA